ncbi:putative monocarboxylate permease [Astrocystis sublimbata]|nr:putative monocarboxylate permease [Astrocystis sublimbata]
MASKLSEEKATCMVTEKPEETKLEAVGDNTAWLQVLGAFLVYVATWGLLSTYGSYQAYYEANILSDTPTDQIAWVGTIQGVLLILGGVITGPIYDHGYMRQLLFAGTFFTILGVMTLSFVTQYYQVLLSQGFCMGIGGGILYIPSLAHVTANFGPKFRPLAVSLATVGTAIGGIVYPIVFDQVLTRVGFPWATRTLGFLTFAELAVALVIILPHHARVRSKHAKSGTVTARPLFDLAAFRDIPFMIFCLALFFMWSAYWVPFFLIPTFAEYALGASQSWGFYILVITNAATIPGRLLAVFIIAYLGVARGMLACSLASAIIFYSWAAVHTLAGFEAWIVFVGLIMVPLAVFYPAIVPLLSPSQAVVGARLGISSAAAALGIILGAPLSSALIDTATGSFWKMQVFIGSTMLVGAVLMAVVCWKLKAH